MAIMKFERIRSAAVAFAAGNPMVARGALGAGRIIKATVKPDYMLGLSLGAYWLDRMINQSLLRGKVEITIDDRNRLSVSINKTVICETDNFLAPYLAVNEKEGKISFELKINSAAEIAKLGRAIRSAVEWHRSLFSQHVDQIMPEEHFEKEVLPLLINRATSARNFWEWDEGAKVVMLNFRHNTGLRLRDEIYELGAQAIIKLLETAATPAALNLRINKISKLAEAYRSWKNRYSPGRGPTYIDFFVKLIELSALFSGNEERSFDEAVASIYEGMKRGDDPRKLLDRGIAARTSPR